MSPPRSPPSSTVFARGPLNSAVRIFSFADFEREFGGLDAASEASYAIQQFFLNGGSEAWVVRTGDAATWSRRASRSVCSPSAGSNVVNVRAGRLVRGVSVPDPGRLGQLHSHRGRLRRRRPDGPGTVLRRALQPHDQRGLAGAGPAHDASVGDLPQPDACGPERGTTPSTSSTRSRRSSSSTATGLGNLPGEPRAASARLRPERSAAAIAATTAIPASGATLTVNAGSGARERSPWTTTGRSTRPRDLRRRCLQQAIQAADPGGSADRRAPRCRLVRDDPAGHERQVPRPRRARRPELRPDRDADVRRRRSPALSALTATPQCPAADRWRAESTHPRRTPPTLRGSRAAKTGLYALEDVSLFNILCVPRGGDARRHRTSQPS